MPRTRGVRAALALGLVALALSACTGDRPGPSPWPSAGLITSPSATATERPMPQVPAAAKVNSPAGAEAFARYVIGAYGYVQQTGDSWPIDSVGGPKCSFCKNVHQHAADMRSRGTHRQGGALTIKLLAAAPSSPANTAVFTITVDQAAAQELDTSGKVVADEAPVHSESLLMALQWKGERWTLFDIGSGADLK